MCDVAIDKIRGDMRHDVCRNREVRKLLDDFRNALIGGLGQSHDNSVDCAFAARRNKIFEFAGDFQAFGIETILAGTIIEDAREMDANTWGLEIIVNPAGDLSGTEDGNPFIKAASRLQI